MSKLFIPKARETERLNLLRAMAILDSPREERFDRIVWLAAQIFDVPMAAIGLLDRDRNWFKASVGLEMDSTDRPLAFCNQTVAQDAPLIVSDAQADQCFQDNPLVTGPPFIRYYLGVPLRVGGIAIGALCVLDCAPRSPYESDVHLLQSMADWVSAELERHYRPAIDAGASQLDRLTGLDSRDALARYLTQLQVSENGLSGSVVVMNIDRFQALNEALGFAGGDQALTQFAARLQTLLEPGEKAARLCGDDFALYLPRADSAVGFDRARRLKAHLVATPLRVADQAFPLHLSMGVSTAAGLNGDVEILLEQANLAMREAKRLGGRQVNRFDPELAAALKRRLKLSSELEKALDAEQFHLVYQPQWTWRGHWALTGVEALVRWQHPELGLVSPAEFIPLAEDSGLIVRLGRQVLDQALGTLAHWRDQLEVELTLAVNLSPVQLFEEDVPLQIRQALAKWALPADCLELEVTETALVRDIEVAGSQLQALHELGVRLALDDFGTGFSSLSHIRDLPFHTIKIDKAFVSDLPDSRTNRAIVDGILTLARGLDKTVVAEGIETREQLQCLIEMGCPLFQGYFLARPVAASDIATMLAGTECAPVL